MSRTATYHTTVSWKGEHWGHIIMGNGPEMDFSAPPDAHGHPGVLTPEDAFVAAVNTCVMMMLIWAAERFRLNLLSAVAASVAVWATYRAGRALVLYRAASLLGAAFLLVSETFWDQATIAEKYALNAMFVALTLWLGLRWRRASGIVLAYHATENGPPTKRQDVINHIRGTSQHLCLFFYVHNWHGGLRGNTRDITPDIFIHDDVSHNRYPCIRKSVNGLLQLISVIVCANFFNHAFAQFSCPA